MNETKEVRCSACNHRMRFVESEHGPDTYACPECGNVVPNWYLNSKEKKEKE